MALDIDGQLGRLRELSVEQLRAFYQQTFGESPPSHHRHHLARRILWRLQALAHGDLTERALQRAQALLGNSQLPNRRPQPGFETFAPTASKARDARLPMPGTILLRRYQGRTLQVRILEEGFEYGGQIFHSLTAVAQQITGQHWNGYDFFGLGEEKRPG